MSGNVSSQEPSHSSSKSGEEKRKQQDQLLFMMLIQQYHQIAQVGLGKIENPATGELEVDLSSARFATDTLTMLQTFTKGNITNELAEYLETVSNPLIKEVKELS